MKELLFLYLGWVGFAVSCGLSEATMFHIMDHDKKKNLTFNIHNYFTLQRVVVWGIMIILMFDHCDRWAVILLGISMVLCFPFIHDGSYYEWRNALDERVYPKGWMSHSETSDSFWEWMLTPLVRIIGCAVSLVFMVSALIIES